MAADPPSSRPAALTAGAPPYRVGAVTSPPAPSRRPFGAGGPTLAEVGEAELLRRLTALALAAAPDPRLVVASGDDAAVWLPPAGDGIVLSQDAIVEGEDFLKSWTDPETVGRRALAVALSDLAAMGAVPHLCMVTYCAPGDAPIDDLLAIQRGPLRRRGGGRLPGRGR